MNTETIIKLISEIDCTSPNGMKKLGMLFAMLADRADQDPVGLRVLYEMGKELNMVLNVGCGCDHSVSRCNCD